MNVVGKSIERFDAADKISGRTAYADDLDIPGVWHGVVVRAPVSRGHLRRLECDAGFDWNAVVLVTPEDIPGNNIVAMMGRDMPLLAHETIQYYGEPLALIAAPTRRLAHEAAAHVHPVMDAQPGIHTLQEVVAQFKRDPAPLHQLAAQQIRKGNVEQALQGAEIVLEREYTAGHQEQLYIEPQGMVAIPEADGTLCIWGSMQCPYYIHTELCETLSIPPEKLRVRQSAVGGAFGGKEDFPTLIAGYCALLALKAGRPVKIIYDRHQDILYTTKRHPSWSRYRVGVNRDGTIVAIDTQLILDGGAYTTLSPVVMYRGMLHAAMGYRCAHVSVDGYVYRTNTFPNGAFRGFGAPQALWAWESMVDELAAACGWSPHAFRLHNALRQGDTTPTGGVLRDSVGSPDVLEKTLERAHFEGQLKRCSFGNVHDTRWYGIGCSFFAHGAGFTGDGEARFKATVALDLERVHDKPMVNVRVSSTEMGQGTCTILPQIAAEALGIDVYHTAYPLPDTFKVPDSGPTVASRTAMVVGSTVFQAGLRMKAELESFASQTFFNGSGATLKDNLFFPYTDGNETRTFEEVASLYLEQKGTYRATASFRLPEFIQWDQHTFRGDAYPAYSWGCNVAEVTVDPVTLEISLDKITAYYDIGRVLNPVLAMGQLEGGLVQAAGYALMEKISVQDGVYDASRMQTYAVPTTLDVPEMDLHFIECPYTHAWPGAKGVGEIPMDGLAPAVANALYRATGCRLRDLPLTPESLWTCLRSQT